MSNRPNCARCGAQLIAPLVDRLTVCPDCGKRWELTADGAAIVGTTLQVQPVTHGTKTRLQGERNG